MIFSISSGMSEIGIDSATYLALFQSKCHYSLRNQQFQLDFPHGIGIITDGLKESHKC